MKKIKKKKKKLNKVKKDRVREIKVALNAKD